MNTNGDNNDNINVNYVEDDDHDDDRDINVNDVNEDNDNYSDYDDNDNDVDDDVYFREQSIKNHLITFFSLAGLFIIVGSKCLGKMVFSYDLVQLVISLAKLGVVMIYFYITEKTNIFKIENR